MLGASLLRHARGGGDLEVNQGKVCEGMDDELSSTSRQRSSCSDGTILVGWGPKCMLESPFTMY